MCTNCCIHSAGIQRYWQLFSPVNIHLSWSPVDIYQAFCCRFIKVGSTENLLFVVTRNAMKVKAWKLARMRRQIKLQGLSWISVLPDNVQNCLSISFIKVLFLSETSLFYILGWEGLITTAFLPRLPLKTNMLIRWAVLKMNDKLLLFLWTEHLFWSCQRKSSFTAKTLNLFYLVSSENILLFLI